MIKAQEKVIEFCRRLSETIKPANLSESLTKEIPALEKNAHERDLVVPVVGIFSSGKSTMINVLLSANILPAGITPETSLATELHFSREEYVEAVKENGDIVRYRVDELSELSAKAADYEYARLYLNNDSLKIIEPLVLVDMPGFDSPLDPHNKAITVYLDRGCHYIVLSGVEEGTISKTLLRRLKEIDGFGRGFHLFISKTDLRPNETTDELRQHYRQQIKDHFDKDIEVLPLDNRSADNVLKVLKSIDADKLFFDMYQERLNILCANCIEEINIKISAISNDENKMAQAIDELNESIANMEKEAQRKAEGADRTGLTDVVDKVVKDIGAEIENAREEIISVAMSAKDPASSVPAIINEIVRTSAISSIKKNMDALAEGINKNCLPDPESLDKVMKDFEIDLNYSSSIFNEIRERMNNILESDFLKFFGIGKLLKLVLPTILSIVEGVFSLIGNIFGVGKDKQRKKIEEWLVGMVIPPIKRGIRKEIAGIIAPAIETIRNNIKELWKQKLENHRDQISKAIEEKKSEGFNVEKERLVLEKVCGEVDSLRKEVRGE